MKKLVLVIAFVFAALTLNAQDGWGGNDDGWGTTTATYGQSCVNAVCSEGLVCSVNYNGNQVCLKAEGQMCGGFAGFQCAEGLNCYIAETYPDAAGTCVAQASCPRIAYPAPTFCPGGEIEPVYGTAQFAHCVMSFKCACDTDDQCAEGKFCKKGTGNCTAKGVCQEPVFASCPPPREGMELPLACTCDNQTVSAYCAPEGHMSINYFGACQ